MTVTVAAVTGPALPAPPSVLLGPALPWPGEGAGAPRVLQQAVLALLPAARGRTALLLPPRPRLRTDPARWRMAEAVLQDAAATGGGGLLRSATGGTLLLGASPAAAARAAVALGILAGEARPLPVWHLPREVAPVLAWAAAETPAPLRPLPLVPCSPAGLHAALDALPAESVLRADPLFSPAGAACGHRLRLCRTAITAALGPLVADPDLLTHAEERMAARLLPGLAAWAADLPGLRLVPLPLDRLPGPARPGAIGVLPLAAAVGLEFPALRQLLAERGWGVALEGLEAAALGLIRPDGLPADLLLLRWSAGLATPDGRAALEGLDPARIVLTGAGDPAAQDFAAARGFRHAASA